MSQQAEQVQRQRVVYERSPRLRRRHANVFTGREALEYLGVAGETDRTLETLRREHGLRCFKIGQRTMYYRAHLDALILRLAGDDGGRSAKPLRIAQG